MRQARIAITAGSGNIVSAHIQAIIDIATANVESLADHGVTQAKIK